MIKALSPRMPRGCSWVWPSVVVLGMLIWLPALAWSQESAKKAESAKEAEKSAGASETKDEATSKQEAPETGEASEADAEAQAQAKVSSIEIYEDPKAVEANQNEFPQLNAGSFNERQVRLVEAMAKEGGLLDTDMVQKYVTKYTADLTNRRYIRGIIERDPELSPNSSEAKGFSQAVLNLQTPLQQARRANNTKFLKVYTDALLAQAPKLLKNHLLARIETAILLANTGSPDVINLLVEQINDKEQTVLVKVWAARGLMNLLQTTAGTYQDLPGGPTATAKAAHALVGFLADKKLHWTAQIRAIEALGCLRMPADPRAQSKIEMGTAVMEILADPKARLEVRAYAAWALAMMRASQANPKFNYKLIAYHAGEVGVELADKITTTYQSNLQLAKWYASRLIYQIYPAFHGVDGARESGLLRMPSLGTNRKYVEDIANLYKPVVKAAVELFKVPNSGRPKAAKELADRASALKAFLAKNVPEDTSFGTQTFPLKTDVAEAPSAGKPEVAGTSSK